MPLVHETYLSSPLLPLQVNSYLCPYTVTTIERWFSQEVGTSTKVDPDSNNYIDNLHCPHIHVP